MFYYGLFFSSDVWGLSISETLKVLDWSLFNVMKSAVTIGGAPALLMGSFSQYQSPFQVAPCFTIQGGHAWPALEHFQRAPALGCQPHSVNCLLQWQPDFTVATPKTCPTHKYKQSYLDLANSHARTQPYTPASPCQSWPSHNKQVHRDHTRTLLGKLAWVTRWVCSTGLHRTPA